MKTFDPMNSGDDDSDFEQQLLGMELRRPPAEWKSLLLPMLVPPWFPKPLLIGLATCWTGIAGFVLTTPRDESPEVPVFVPAPPSDDSILLSYQPPHDSLR
jgi:hypothetical protein